jgi:hypothetical protein
VTVRGPWIGLVVALGLALLAPAGQASSPRCDPLDPARCLLPWPNDHFMRHGHLALTRGMMPHSRDGRPVDPKPYNASDGFSPGQTIVTRVPGLSLRRSHAVPVTDLPRAFARRAPIVVIDARTRARQLVWAELDAYASPRRRALLIHPAVNFREGHRYIVALRNLRNARGGRLRARRAFRVYRDRLPARSRAVRARRSHMESLFRTLRRVGIRRKSLYLAWDFTVASRRSLTRRLLSIRNRAFAALGDRDLSDLTVEGRPPAFAVDRVSSLAGGVRRVDGHFTVPCFLNRPGCPPGARFALSRRGLPKRIPGNTMSASFVCLVPPSLGPGHIGRPFLFGHGLFGGADAVLGLARTAVAAGAVICGADWVGMSRADLPNVFEISRNAAPFPSLPDRLQQAMVNFSYLGRLMIHPTGLSSDPAFAGTIDTRRLFFLGVSQGGILGGILTAVAPDFTRAALVVPGMNFSVLMSRSSQFAPYFAVIKRAYPNGLDRALLLSMIQVQWDRGEANGYAWHMTGDPLPGTPRHAVLLHEAFGDHQVTNVATETEARTIGAALRMPALDPGRSRDREPFYRIPRLDSSPFGGSSLSVWDIGPLRDGGTKGTPPPPTTNTPPLAGVDPHAITAREPAASEQISDFLRLGGAFVDTCGAEPCRAAGWTGSP